VSGIEISIYRVYQNNLTNIKIEFFTENKIITCSQIDLMYNTQVLLNSILKIFLSVGTLEVIMYSVAIIN